MLVGRWRGYYQGMALTPGCRFGIFGELSHKLRSSGKQRARKRNATLPPMEAKIATIKLL